MVFLNACGHGISHLLIVSGHPENFLLLLLELLGIVNLALERILVI